LITEVEKERERKEREIVTLPEIIK